MNRRTLFVALAWGIASLPGCAGSTAQAQTEVTAPARTASEQADAPRPNVLFILLDDLGYGQLGITGHAIIKTPNIDRLATQGMLFTNGYSGSTVCSPSRVSLMTGRDTSRLASPANDLQLQPGDRTIAHVLSEAGYNTALFGKFGIGTRFGATDPMAMGFQHWVGVMHNIEAHRQHPTFVYRDNEVTFVPGNIGGAKGTYAQRLFTDAALEYLDRQDGTSPFFVLMSYTSPHSELAAPEEFVAPYRNRFPETPYNGLRGPTPAEQFPQYYPEPISQPNAVQAGMVAALDAYIGELIAKLDAKGIANNTLIILSSDNGPHSEGGGDPIGLAAAGPFRGGKRELTEGGIHMPFIARWPGVIRAGRTEATPVMFADVLPTLGTLAGRPNAAQAIGANGVSLADLILREGASMPERMLYWAFAGQLGDPNSKQIDVVQQAGRMGKWKAYRAHDKAPIELYDLSRDPGEKVNLAQRYPDIVADFTVRFDARLAEQARYAR
jgi:arylsulfatase A-like enzyme